MTIITPSQLRLAERHRSPDASFLKNYAKYSQSYAFKEWGNYDRMVEMVRKAPKGEVVIGAHDREFSTDAVTIPYLTHERTIISGSPGDGKSNMALGMLWQRYWRFGNACAISDPKNEYGRASLALKDKEMVERLESYGLTTKGLPLFKCVPHFIAEDGLINTEDTYVYNLELSDFKHLSRQSDRFFSLMEFLGLQQDSASAPRRQLEKYMNKLPDTFEEFETMLEKELDSRRGNRTAAPKTLTLLSTISGKRISGQIGEKSARQLYPPDLMMKADGRQGSIPCLQLTIESSEEWTSSFSLKMFVQQIIEDRRKAKYYGKGRLTSPVTILFDEADAFAKKGSKSPSKGIMESIPLKYRIIDLASIFVTQKSWFLSDRIVGNCSHYFTSRPQTKAEYVAFKERGVDTWKAEQIFGKLYHKDKDPVKEFGLIYGSGEIDSVYPLPAPVQMLSHSGF